MKHNLWIDKFIISIRKMYKYIGDDDIVAFDNVVLRNDNDVGRDEDTYVVKYDHRSTYVDG